MKDLEREEVYNKVWDYLLHGITVRCAFVVIVVVVVYLLVFLFPAYTLQEPSLFLRRVWDLLTPTLTSA